MLVFGVNVASHDDIEASPEMRPVENTETADSPGGILSASRKRPVVGVLYIYNYTQVASKALPNPISLRHEDRRQ